MGARTIRQGVHLAGETAERGIEAVGDMARRGASAGSTGTRDLVERTAGQIGEIGKRMAEAAERTTEDLRTLMSLPGFGGGMEQVQQVMTGLVHHMIEVNLQANREILRVANPGTVIELQQRFARRYLNGLIESSAEILRVSRQIADEALRPIEQRSRQLQRQEDSPRHGGNGDRRQGHGHDDHEGYRQAHDGQDGSGTVAEVMTPGTQTVEPDQSVQEAAQLMAELDTGALPVGEDDRLVGMLTDRDIAIRVTAEGKDPAETPVREVMTPDVRYCFEDEDVEHVAENMAEQQLRRLPVVSRDKRLVGIVSLGDIATSQPARVSGAALRGISQKAGQQQHAYAGSKPGRRRGAA
jgi:CBS domain-containing protein